MMFMSVDLPEPEGPMIAMYSFVATVRSTPFERAHLGVAHRVDLLHARDLDDGPFARPLETPEAPAPRATAAPPPPSSAALMARTS